MGITIKTEYEFTVRIKLREYEINIYREIAKIDRYLAVKALHNKYPETTLQQAYEIVHDLMIY